MKTPPTESYIDEKVKEFEEKYLSKWISKNADVFTFDGDSRGMKERGRDFLRSALLDLVKRIEEDVAKLPKYDTHEPPSNFWAFKEKDIVELLQNYLPINKDIR